MKPLILHPEAEKEFENDAAYFENQRKGYGKRFREAIAEAIAEALAQALAEALAQISSTPSLFASYKNSLIRRRLVTRFGYGVYFLEQDDVIFIVAIANQRRRPDYWKDRVPQSYP